MLELTVYVVDCDETIRDELVDEISACNYLRAVGARGDGEKAFIEIMKIKPDVILTDLILPSLDGYGLIERLRKSGIKSRIIAVSSLAGDGFIKRALELGADFYMIKPVSPKRLVEVIIDDCENEKGNKTEIKEKSFEAKIATIFMSVGIPAHIKGYRYLREAVRLAVGDPDIMNSITKELYPTVAEIHMTSASKVERAIRHAIEVAWNKGKIENLNHLFGIKVYSSEEKPTNGEFIALIADKILIDNL